MSQTIRYETVLNATPAQVYETLTDSKKFSAMSGGAPADISREVGGKFSCFGGFVSGLHVELIPGQRVIQAWRGGDWASGEYSIVSFEMKPEGKGTRLVLTQAGHSAERTEHLTAGWKAHYLDPMTQHFA